MIECYLDESGIHDQASVCVIAGYYAGTGQWKKFSQCWQRVLSSSAVPLGEFHAKDFVKTARFRGTVDALTNLISTSKKIHPVSVGVVVSDFRSLSEKQRRFLTGGRVHNGDFVSSGSPNKPYFLPFIHCVERVAGYSSAGGKVNFFCGLDRDFANYATELFNSVKTDQRLGTIDHPLAKETPQLQAADLLAHLTYLNLDLCVRSGDWDQPLSPLLSKCIRNARWAKDDFVYFNQASMKKTFEVDSAVKAL